MKAAVIIAILAAVALAMFLYGVLTYVTRGYIWQDRQEGATAPCVPADPCEDCSVREDCGPLFREACLLRRAYKEVTHGKETTN